MKIATSDTKCHAFARRQFRRLCEAATFCALLILFMAAVSNPACASQRIGIKILSSRPDMVSGGAALVQVTGPAEMQKALHLGQWPGRYHRVSHESADTYLDWAGGWVGGRGRIGWRSSPAARSGAAGNHQPWNHRTDLFGSSPDALHLPDRVGGLGSRRSMRIAA